MLPRELSKNFRTSKIQQLTFAASARITRDIPKTVYCGLTLELNITHASGTLTIAHILSCLPNIEVVINGRDTVFNAPLSHFYYQQLADTGVAPMQLLASLGTNTYVIVYLPFELINTVLPEDTLLNARSAGNIDSVVLALTCGPATVNALAITEASSFVKISASTYGMVPNEQQFGSHEYATLNRTISATGDLEIIIPVAGQNQYRRIWIQTITGGALSDVVISNFKLATDTFVYHDVEDQHLKADNMRKFGLAATITGVYCLELTSHGLMSQRIDARRLDELTLTLTAIATGSVIIVLEKAIYA